MALSVLEWTYLDPDEREKRIGELSERDLVSVRMGQDEVALAFDEMVEKGEASREEQLREIRQ